MGFFDKAKDVAKSAAGKAKDAYDEDLERYEDWDTDQLQKRLKRGSCSPIEILAIQRILKRRGVM